MTKRKRYIPASELQLGDYIDLQGDKYADPTNDHPCFASEYAIVDHIEHETTECVAVGIEGFDIVGFPVDHPIRLIKRLED